MSDSKEDTPSTYGSSRFYEPHSDERHRDVYPEAYHDTSLRSRMPELNRRRLESPPPPSSRPAEDHRRLAMDQVGRNERRNDGWRAIGRRIDGVPAREQPLLPRK